MQKISFMCFHEKPIYRILTLNLSIFKRDEVTLMLHQCPQSLMKHLSYIRLYNTLLNAKDLQGAIFFYGVKTCENVLTFDRFDHSRCLINQTLRWI